jgi:hypothetical protein
MAEGARRERWDHTASLAAVILNSRFGLRKGQMVSALNLHPMRDGPPKEVVRGPRAWSMLQAAFGGQAAS